MQKYHFQRALHSLPRLLARLPKISTRWGWKAPSFSESHPPALLKKLKCNLRPGLRCGIMTGTERTVLRVISIQAALCNQHCSNEKPFKHRKELSRRFRLMSCAGCFHI